ncbi:hypothetical protein E3T24_02710 [Cryobacterium sp. TmT2-59]|uniref:sensor histidine kinase n=1 Tax=Cryobacterium sp. TmT2-59 TaxID=1259264 RepID=UPI00106A63E4|nr:histidine kinase [Cryobacterium sp. TmT2-59]TFC88404.1 hypothetical protein E3T24_02710 [Cryobacterium sp. TmT2-59]
MREHRVSSVSLTTAAWMFGATVTGLILWSPWLDSGFRSPNAHLALDTVYSCVALLVAYLVFGKYARRRRLSDLLLANGLVLLAVPGLGLSAAAEALSGPLPGSLDVWLPLTIRVMGAAVIAAAAMANFGRPRKLADIRRSQFVPMAVIMLLVVTCLALWAARLSLPVTLDRGGLPAQGQDGITEWHPLVPIAQGVAAVCFFTASVAFAVQSRRYTDELLRWLGPACALAGFSRLDYTMFPSRYSDWLYAGDLLRAGCYVLLLVGAARELRQYWSAQSLAAVEDDRHRVARELHDGVVQELIYIRSASHAIPAEVVVAGGAPGNTIAPGNAAVRILAACDRALDEIRAAVQALGRPNDEPLGIVLRRTARELAMRYSVTLDVDIDESIVANWDQKHSLMRIAQEAVANAVHHGRAQRVLLHLGSVGGERQLLIRDNGLGFNVAETLGQNAGYGLLSMRERAQALPGSFEVDRAFGHGMVVKVTW